MYPTTGTFGPCRCQFSLFKLSCFLLATSRLETRVQLPISRWGAIHFRLMLVSFPYRAAIRTLRLSPFLTGRKSAPFHAIRPISSHALRHGHSLPEVSHKANSLKSEN